LLIRHSRYSAMVSKYTPTDCFFGVLIMSNVTKLFNAPIRTERYLTLNSERAHGEQF